MSLSAAEIAAVVAELAPLAGSRVEAVRLHRERALTLELRGRVGTALLLVSAEPGATRIHAAASRPPAPAAPPPLQALLRRELGGARLSSIASAPGERLVELAFDRPGSRGPVRLVAELTGRSGNLLLVAADGTIRASAARGPGPRRLSAGEPYRPPPARAEPLPEGARLPPAADATFPLSAAIEARYLALEAERDLGEGRRRLREPIRAALARAGRALERLAEEAARVPAAEEDRRLADLLKQNLGAVGRGASRAVLTEWTADGPREVAVDLDPALGPRENMERIYRRARRIAESAGRVAARAAEVRARVERLGALRARIDGARLEDLPRLEKEARRLGAGPPPVEPPRRGRAGREEERAPYRTFRALSGEAILVGRGPEENDALTVRVARGNDLWLHARGGGGAHVVVRLARGAGPDQETLLDAAHLAAWFSQARGEPSADVTWTRAKHVRKARGSAPGAVTFSQDRTLLLRVEPDRLERLLASEE